MGDARIAIGHAEFDADLIAEASLHRRPDLRREARGVDRQGRTLRQPDLAVLSSGLNRAKRQTHPVQHGQPNQTGSTDGAAIAYEFAPVALNSAIGWKITRPQVYDK